MPTFARGARLSVESLETRETPAGRIFFIYATGPGPERLGSDTSAPAQVRLTAPNPSPVAVICGGHLCMGGNDAGADIEDPRP